MDEVNKVLKAAIDNLEDEIHRRKASGMYTEDLPDLKRRKAELEVEYYKHRG